MKTVINGKGFNALESVGNFLSTSTSNSTSNSKPWASAHTDQGRRARLPWNPALITPLLRKLGWPCFRHLGDSRKMSPLSGTFASASSHRSRTAGSARFFECGLDILKDKYSLDFEFRKASAAFKTTSRERRKTAWGFTRVEARTESTAQRRSLRR